MLIIADEQIPCVEHYFGSYGEIQLKSGRSLQHQDVVNADILLMRSVTPVNQALLHNTQVKFVGSVVTGTDHLDIPYLNKEGIRWAAALGCNAMAVAEYVVTVVAALQTQGILLQKKPRAAVVGVGRVGSKVVAKLSALGFEVVQCDPVRAKTEKEFVSTPLDQLTDLDLILLHTPLTTDGPDATFHMIDQHFLKRQKPGCVLLNAGRGSVIHFADLLQYGEHLVWCLDVWENEPHIDKAILFKTVIATPHIAGHSVQSKYRGIEMVYQAALDQEVLPQKNITPIEFPTTEIMLDPHIDWQHAVLSIFNPLEVSEKMKAAYLSEDNKGLFDQLRQRFKRGYEFDYVYLKEKS